MKLLPDWKQRFYGISKRYILLPNRNQLRQDNERTCMCHRGHRNMMFSRILHAAPLGGIGVYLVLIQPFGVYLALVSNKIKSRKSSRKVLNLNKIPLKLTRIIPHRSKETSRLEATNQKVGDLKPFWRTKKSIRFRCFSYFFIYFYNLKPAVVKPLRVFCCPCTSSLTERRFYSNAFEMASISCTIVSSETAPLLLIQ